MNQLTIQDLNFVVNLIDACVERGAFKGNEIYNVGQLREKLAAVVVANTPEASQEKPEN